MTQDRFEREREARWTRFEAMLAALERGQRADAGFPALYRLVCQDLALARDRGFGPALVDRLNTAALQAHQLLYGSRSRPGRPLDFLARRFPAAVRREGRLLGAAALVFFGSMALFYALDVRDPSLIYHVISVERVETFEAMYDPEAEHYGTPRGTAGDLAAFSFYVSNNVGVALRTFAWGIFLGLGSVFVLLMNGVVIGLIAAHVSLEGYAGTFFPFVIGHGALELPAIALAGGAGAKLGWALVAPGSLWRADALRKAARECLPLVYGAAVMLLVAAVIEAMWSANAALPAEVKLASGTLLWVGVGLWLGFGGRGRAD